MIRFANAISQCVTVAIHPGIWITKISESGEPDSYIGEIAIYCYSKRFPITSGARVDNPFPAYQGDHPYIFVSYAHNDADLVFPEMQRLSDQGFKIWYDEGIKPGASWREEVALALTESKLLIYFVTENSVKSENCHQELNFALSRERKILAVHLSPVKLTAGIELSLSNKQAILKHEMSDQAFAGKLAEAARSMMPAITPIAVQEIKGPVVGDQKSIAILPLNNRSSDPENEYLCDGVAEELITGLAKVEGLRVASQLQSFAYKGLVQDIGQIGQKLRVANVLTGSIQKSGERVRISMTLTETETGDIVWSERYDGTLEDVFELQEDVANKVVSSLELKLTGNNDTPVAEQLIDTGTKKQVAYQHYLLGRFEFHKGTRQSYLLAHEQFDKATKVDPGYGRAYYFDFLCWNNSRREGFVDHEVFYPRAKSALQNVFTTDFTPPLPRSHLERRLNENFELEWTIQERMNEVFEVFSSETDWHGFELVTMGEVLIAAGLLNGACDFFQQYLDKYPAYAEFTNIRPTYANLLFALGRFDKAIDMFSAAYAQNPTTVLNLGTRAMLYSRTGQYQKAEADLRELSKTFPRNFAQFYDLYWHRELDAASAYFEWMEGQKNLLPLFKIWGSFLLGQIERGFDYIEAMNANSFGLRLMFLCVLTPSIIRKVTSHARYEAQLTRHGIDAAFSDEVLRRVNEIEDITGIHVALDEDY